VAVACWPKDKGIQIQQPLDTTPLQLDSLHLNSIFMMNALKIRWP